MTPRSVLAVLALLSGGAASGAAQAPATRTSTPPSILGYWRGRSTCVKASWNAACNDEDVLYHFVPSLEHPGQVMLNAFKYANGAPEPMYDLGFAWDSTRHEWAARYSNSRVHILWSYAVHDTLLAGRLVDLPGERLVREVRATFVSDSAGLPGKP